MRSAAPLGEGDYPENPSLKRARLSALGGMEALEAPVAAALAHMRRCAAACSARHHYAGAAWYADKALALSAGSPRDAYLLAEAQMQNGEPARALRTLESRGLLDPARHPALPHAPSGGASSSSSSSAPVHTAGGSGAMRADYLPFVYLGALCLRGMRQWAQCLELLESAMEGPGHPGLRTPLRPIPSNVRAAAASALGAACGRGGCAASGGLPPQPQPHQPLCSSMGSPSPASNAMATSPLPAPCASAAGFGATASASAAASAIATPWNAPGMHHAAATPSSGGLGKGIMLFSGRAEVDSSQLLHAFGQAQGAGAGGGGEGGPASASPCEHALPLEDLSDVWRVVYELALQHSDSAIALSAAAGAALGACAPPALTLGLPAGEPIALRGVPFSPGLPPAQLEACGGYVPLGDGSRLNLVSCLASLRGEVLMACENRLRATQWLLAALRIDPYNVQAYTVRAPPLFSCSAAAHFLPLLRPPHSPCYYLFVCLFPPAASCSPPSFFSFASFAHRCSWTITC